MLLMVIFCHCPILSVSFSILLLSKVLDIKLLGIRYVEIKQGNPKLN